MTGAFSARVDALPEIPDHDDPVSDAQALMALPVAPMLAMFERTATLWKLTRDERLALLDISSASTYGRWQANPERVKLDLRTREAIADVIAIHVACVTLFGLGDASSGWVKRPNTGSLFAGAPPIRRMASGLHRALTEVRRHLELEVRR